jgi:hypothetical protein
MAIACAASPADGERVNVGLQLFLGLVAGGVGLVAAITGALARGPKVAALAVATVCAPWTLAVVRSDLDAAPPISAFDAAATGHRVAAEQASALVHLGAATSAAGLAVLALAFALRATERPAWPLPRALAVGLAPLALLAVVVGLASHLPLLALSAAVLALTVVARAAARTALDASFPSFVVVLATATLALAAATSDAAAHGTFLVIDAARSAVDAPSLAPWIARLGRIELAQLAPLAALLPFFALGSLVDLRGRGVGGLALRSLAPLALVLVGMIWLDARNALDYRRELRALLDSAGDTDLLAHPDVRPPLVFYGGSLDASFVVVTPSGVVSYRGRALPGGLSALGALVHGHDAPPVLLDRGTRAPALVHVLDALGHGGAREVSLVARDHGGGRLVTFSIGPYVRGIPPSSDRIIVFLAVDARGCTLGSTAGERIEMPGCAQLDERLAERHAADPNSSMIVLDVSSALDLQRVLDVADSAARAGYTLRPILLD